MNPIPLPLCLVCLCILTIAFYSFSRNIISNFSSSSSSSSMLLTGRRAMRETRPSSPNYSVGYSGFKVGLIFSELFNVLVISYFLLRISCILHPSNYASDKIFHVDIVPGLIIRLHEMQVAHRLPWSDNSPNTNTKTSQTIVAIWI